MIREKGRVYLVGAGPGGQDLITVKGLEILRQADTVIYDYLVDKRLLSSVKKGAELICCDKLGKSRHRDGFLISQERINDLMVRKARELKVVVRLKNGDPSLFSRLSQELEALLRNKIEFEIIPGITAASAASCLSGIPLTDRRFASSCVFVTGHEDPAKEESSLDWEAISKSGTIVLYMAVENLTLIREQLLKAKKSPDTPCAIIQDAALSSQRVLLCTLKDIAKKAQEEKVKPPAIIIIGEVIKFERRFNWFKRLPLFNRRILITRPEEQAPEFAKLLERYGATTYILPTVKIKDINPKKLDERINSISSYDWIIFLSQNGVRAFFERLRVLGKDIRILGGIKLCAIGPKTKEAIENSGIRVEVMPKEFYTEGILDVFKRIDISQKRILVVCSSVSDNILIDGLKTLGAKVDYIYGYRATLIKKNARKIKRLLNEKCIDLITFTSPSCVKGFMNGFGKAMAKKSLNGICFASIGPVTGAALVRYGIKANIKARDYTIESLAKGIVDYYRNGG